MILSIVMKSLSKCMPPNQLPRKRPLVLTPGTKRKSPMQNGAKFPQALPHYMSTVVTCSTASTYTRFRTTHAVPGGTLNMPLGPILKSASAPGRPVGFTESFPVAREHRRRDSPEANLCDPPGFRVMTLKPTPGSTGTAMLEKR